MKNQNIMPQQPWSSPGPQKQSPPTTSAIDFKHLIGMMWRGKWIIVACLAAALLISGYYVKRIMVPIYRATTVVMLEPNEQKVVNLDSIIPGLPAANASVINSEVEVLRSLGLLGKVVDHLGLTSDPEFNASLRLPSLKAQLQDRIFTLLNLHELETVTPDSEEIRANTVSMLRQVVTIRNLPSTLVFNIQIDSENAKKAALIANTLADLYILNQVEVKFEATERATAWLAQRVTELQGDLENAETRVRDFRASIDLVSPENLQALERQAKEIRDRLASTREALDQQEERQDALRLAKSYEDKASIADDSQLTNFLPNIGTPSIRTAFDNRFDALVSRSQDNLGRLRTQVTTLETSAVEQEAQVAQQSNDLIRLEQLTREAEASRLLYEYLLTRLKETSAQQGIQQADSRILSSAVIPKLPAAPDTGMIITMSGIIGCVAGAAIILLQSVLRNTFVTGRDLEISTGYVVMGQIPEIPRRQRQDAIRYIANNPLSEISEAIRNIRTSVMLSNIEHPPQVITITSALPGEGKTTLSIALAQNITNMGKKVLLIEGDIRRRIFQHYIDLSSTKGLASVLDGKSSIQDAVMKTDLINCDILSGQDVDLERSDPFTSKGFDTLIMEARKLYDFIIIDTPPVLIIPDARIIMQYTDAAIFVVAWGRTSKPQVEEALNIFETSGQRINGLVLNSVNRKKLDRMGYGGNYGAYGKYGKRYYSTN
ncbi:GumC family protein [Roseibium sp.]|uniref:GumC family protein n=1 Tax=Roseibium sp. TaxID=1936156 RepID=UPI003A972511